VTIGTPHVDLRAELLRRMKHEFVDRLSPDERAAVEAATGEMGNKPDAVKLGWLRMRTKDSWTKQRYTITVARALAKLRTMVEQNGGEGPAEKARGNDPRAGPGCDRAGVSCYGKR
jgi:hypothetical protein